MKTFKKLCLPLLASLVLGPGYLSGTVRAQSPVGTVSNIPVPNTNANAFSTSLRYDSNGNLYAWDGLSVWEQNGGTGAFNNIGSVTAGNQADAGPISFSQNGQSVLLSNGAGGYNFLGNGVFWTMPASGGAATQVTGSGVPYTYDALALTAASTILGSGTKYIVNAGTSDYSSSSLSIFDAVTGTDKVVINNGPGATTSIAINPKNNSLYVGVGYGSDAGNIYSFSLSQIDSAYNSGTPINFLSGGSLFDPAATGSQSGAGMFFDSNGYLFSGGDGITVFRPNGTISYDQPSGPGDGYYVTLTYNPANNEVLKVPYSSSTGTLYNAASFETVLGLYFSGTYTWDQGATAKWSSQSGGPYNQTWSSGSNAVFEGTAGTVTVSGTISSVNAITFTTDGYTLGGTGTITLTGSGGNITTGAGADTINATIAGSVGLTKQGSGKLTLNGANAYTGPTTVKAGTLELGPSAQNQVLSGGGANILAGSLAFDYIGSSPASAIQSLLTTSYNGGVSSWTTGQFLTSGSTTAGIPVTLGWIDNGSNVTVAATIAGDANCDGSVDLSDLNTLIGNYGMGTTWAQGDFRYTGVTSLADLNALIGNYGKTGPVNSAVVVAGMGVSTVPEPSTMALILSALAALLWWRRARTR